MTPQELVARYRGPAVHRLSVASMRVWLRSLERRGWVVEDRDDFNATPAALRYFSSLDDGRRREKAAT